MIYESNESSGAAGDYHVPNLDRALEVLEYLAERPGAGISRLAEALRVPKNSVFRITRTLLRRGYLQRDGATKGFHLSRKLLALGYAATNRHTVVENSLDIMRELRDRTRETVLLGTLVGREGVVLEQVFGLHPFKFMVDAGTRFSLHTSAPGKALLAFLPAEEREQVLRGLRLVRYNDRSITTRPALRRELEGVRRAGYAVDRAEEIEGCHCVGAPVLDSRGWPVAALWVTGPANRMPVSSFPALGRRVREGAERISRRLGCDAVLMRPQRGGAP